jgi:VanZ family protein
LNKKLFWWGLAGLFFVGFYFFTSSPVSNDAHTLMLFKNIKFLSNVDIVLLDKIIRKCAHFLSYGILAIIVKNALQPRRWAYPGAWLIATLYGASDEIHQIFVPGRTPLATDVMIDSAGACAVLLVAYVIKLARDRKHKV